MAAQLPGNSNNFKDPEVNFLLAPGQELLPCPYDKVHFVFPMNFATHLSECRYNYLNDVKSGRKELEPEEVFVVCQFTYLHHVQKGMLAEHEKNCEKNPNSKFNQDISKVVYEQNKSRKLEVLEDYDQKFVKEEQDLHVFPGGRGDPGAGPYGVKASGAGFLGPQETSMNERLLTNHREADPNENWKFGPISSSSSKMLRNDSLKSEPSFETDPVTLARRQKQIEYGKRTQGYMNYLRTTPKESRTKRQLKTPDRNKKASRRSWDGQIQTWRLLLHAYDDPKDENEPIKSLLTKD